MESQAQFDAFYADARTDLLTETLALTGDVTAARSAVRDAFAIAFHHWRKVRRLEDRTAWVRPYAWRRAQRHHQTRIWHRDKSLPEDARAVLDALGNLSTTQRRTLLLSHLSTLSLPEIARVVGLPLARTEDELQSATAAFTLALDVPGSQARHEFESLRRVAEQVTWPRVTIVRRAGAARRRSHTAVGVLGTVAIMLLGGSLAQSGSAGSATLDADRFNNSTPGGSDDAPVQLDTENLLVPDQVARIAPALDWAETRTTENTDGEPVLAHCQPDRFADVKGLGTLVRTFEGTPAAKGSGKKARAAQKAKAAEVMQTVELSRNTDAAAKTYRRVLGWYAACSEPRTQLVATRKVKRVGEKATQFQLRTWGKRPRAITVTVARTGQLTLTTVDTTARARPERSAGLMLAAVNSVCGDDVAPTCATEPRLKTIEPLTIGKPLGMLKELDLPPVSGAKGTWVGTDVGAMQANSAATVCDPATFTGKPKLSPVSRTFVFPKERKARGFGLSQVVGRGSVKASKTFVAQVRDRLGGCEDRNMAVTVSELPGGLSTKKRDLAAWHLDVELDDDRKVQYLMAVVRDGRAVSQIGFVPTSELTISRADFSALARRALSRVALFRRP